MLEKYFSNVRGVYTKYAEFLGDFFSKYIKYVLVAFGLAPAAGIVINNV